MYNLSPRLMLVAGLDTDTVFHLKRIARRLQITRFLSLPSTTDFLRQWSPAQPGEKSTPISIVVLGFQGELDLAPHHAAWLRSLNQQQIENKGLSSQTVLFAFLKAQSQQEILGLRRLGFNHILPLPFNEKSFFREVVSKLSNGPSTFHLSQALTLAYQGLAQGKWFEVDELLESGPLEWEKSGEILTLKAACKIHLNDLTEAKSLLAKLRQLGFQSSYSQYVKIKYWLTTQQKAKALQEAREWASQHHDSPFASLGNGLNPSAHLYFDVVALLNQHALSLVQKGELEEALPIYETAREIASSHSQRHTLTHNLATLLARMGRIPEALETLLPVLTTNSEIPPALNQLAKILTHQISIHLHVPTPEHPTPVPGDPPTLGPDFPGSLAVQSPVPLAGTTQTPPALTLPDLDLFDSSSQLFSFTESEIPDISIPSISHTPADDIPFKDLPKPLDRVMAPLAPLTPTNDLLEEEAKAEQEWFNQWQGPNLEEESALQLLRSQTPELANPNPTAPPKSSPLPSSPTAGREPPPPEAPPPTPLSFKFKKEFILFHKQRPN